MAKSYAHHSAKSWKEKRLYFPFNGTCKCSSGGDIKLTFESSSSLRTHSSLLKMASPVFDSMLTDCAETKTVSLGRASREVWVQILNNLHPSGPSFFPDFDPFRNVNRLVSRQ